MESMLGETDMVEAQVFKYLRNILPVGIGLKVHWLGIKAQHIEDWLAQ